MTCSRILLSLPGPARTEEEARNSIDGVEDSDMEYESMDSTVPGGVHDKCPKILYTDTKISDKMESANSTDPDQLLP